MIDIVFYYAFYASAVLFYGIGFEHAAVLSVSFDKAVVRSAVRSGISAVSAAFLTELAARNLLAPVGVVELFPLAALFILAAVSACTGLLLKSGAILHTKEFACSYLIVLLSLFESSSPLDALIAAASCVLSFLFVIPVLQAIRYRIDIARSKDGGKAGVPLIMIVSAILIVACAAWNVSWLADYFSR